MQQNTCPVAKTAMPRIGIRMPKMTSCVSSAYSMKSKAYRSHGRLAAMCQAHVTFGEIGYFIIMRFVKFSMIDRIDGCCENDRMVVLIVLACSLVVHCLFCMCVRVNEGEF